MAQKYPNKAFLIPNLGIFILSQNFAVRQIRGCWFQIWQYSFQIPAQKHPNKTFLDFSFFHEFLKFDKFEGASFKYENSFLKI